MTAGAKDHVKVWLPPTAHLIPRISGEESQVVEEAAENTKGEAGSAFELRPPNRAAQDGPTAQLVIESEVVYHAGMSD